MKPAYLAPLILIFIAGCVGASTFGMNEDVYQRTLASLKDRMVSLEVNKIDFTGSPGKPENRKRNYYSSSRACTRC